MTETKFKLFTLLTVITLVTVKLEIKRKEINTLKIFLKKVLSLQIVFGKQRVSHAVVESIKIIM